MARITVEDCLKRVPNRFVIVNLAAQRVRQIREGSEYLVSSPKNEDIVVALREIAAGKVTLKNGADKKADAKADTKPVKKSAEPATETEEETGALKEAAATKEAVADDKEDASSPEDAPSKESD